MWKKDLSFPQQRQTAAEQKKAKRCFTSWLHPHTATRSAGVLKIVVSLSDSVSAVMQQYTLQLIVFNYLILILHKVWEHQGDCVHVYLLSANKNSSVFFCMCASERAPQRQRLQMAVKQ